MITHIKEHLFMAVSVSRKSFLSQTGSFLKLLRPKHYVKNTIIFLPLVFSKRLFDLPLLVDSLFGFAAFAFISSLVYVINDIRDIEKDRAHPTKCKRPLASGAVSVKSAVTVGVILFVLSMLMNYLSAALNPISWGILLCYFVLNLGYSFGLKNVPLLDIAILASGFLLRLLYGSCITGIQLSAWICLTTVLASFYLGFGKRRNEYTLESANKRDVLNFYSYDFLDKSMHMCMTLALVFYSLWTLDVSQGVSSALIWTVPLLLLIVLKYNFNIEKNTDGDPTEVIFGDRILLVMILIYMLIMFAILYC